MPTSPDDLRYARLEGSIEVSAGALVPVEIGMPRYEIEQFHVETREVPLPRRGFGRIDSGADVSCVKVEVVEYLRVPQIGTQLLHTASVPVNRGVYAITVTMGWDSENPPDPIDLQVIAISIPDVDMLVGRDVLRLGELFWDGPEARFEWALPRGRGGQSR